MQVPDGHRSMCRHSLCWPAGKEGQNADGKIRSLDNFYTQCHSHKAQRNVYADKKLHDLQSKGITEKPPKVLKN